MMKSWVIRICIMIFALLLMFSILTVSANAAWWDGNWPYKMPINLSVSSGSTPANYSVEIELNSSNVGSGWDWNNECSNNESRVRFVDSSESDELDYWIKDCDVSAEEMFVWVEFNETITTTDKTMWLYYGNSLASLKSSGEDTFDFFMNFSAWTISPESNGQDISGGINILYGGYGLNVYGNPWKIWHGFPTLNIYNNGSQRMDMQMQSNDCGEISGIEFDTNTVQSGANAYRWCGSQTNWGDAADDSYSESGNWEDVHIIFNDFTQGVTHIHLPGDDDADASTDTTYRNMRIRKYVSVEPTYTIGAVEVVNTTLTRMSPENGTAQRDLNIVFNCSAATSNTSLLSNISLFGNFSGNWELNSTNSVSGNINSTTFSLTMPNRSGTYIWTCRVYDNASIYDYFDENYTLVIDRTAPSITINSPVGTVADTTPTVNVTFSEDVSAWYNINDGVNVSLCSNCSSYDIEYLHLSEGTYNINVYANDSYGNFNSSIGNSFTIDMNGNYYDAFDDNSSVGIYNDVKWDRGNVTYAGSGVSYYNGIQIGYKSGNLNYFRNQWGGSANVGEIDITCPGGDANCWFVAPNGINISSLHIGNGIAATDGTTGTWGFIMYSATNVLTRLSPTPHNLNSQNFIGVCYKSGQWYYDDNNNNGGDCDNPFTPDSTDILMANVSWGVTSITSLEGVAGGGGVTNFTSYEINTTRNITQITNVTWTELGTDANNNVTMQISVDDGLNWTNVTNGNSITNLSANNSLVYRVIFDADGTKEFGISDLNISWKHADITNPIVTLVAPDNSSKLIGNGSVSFAFNVSDNDAFVNCSFFLNGALNKSWNCSTGVNLTVNLTLDRGFYYWYVLANDSANNTDISENRSLWIIDDYSARVEKKITSESSGMYKVQTIVRNLVDTAIRFTLYDFVDRSFNYGSFNVAQNITNSTTGPDYIGDVLGWFMNYSTNSSLERNYSIAGTNNNYSLSDEFVIGLD